MDPGVDAMDSSVGRVFALDSRTKSAGVSGTRGARSDSGGNNVGFESSPIPTCCLQSVRLFETTRIGENISLGS